MKILKRFFLALALLFSTISCMPIQTSQKVYEATRVFPKPGTAGKVTIFYKQIETHEQLQSPSTQFSFVDDTSRKEFSCFSQTQTHSFIENSKIPAVQILQRLTEQARKNLATPKTKNAEFSATFEFEDVRKAVHAHVKLSKRLSSSQAFNATVTLSGFTPKPPAQILNFFTAIMLDDTLWQKHYGKTLGSIGLTFACFLLSNKTSQKPPQRLADDSKKKSPHTPPQTPNPPAPPARRAPADTQDPVVQYFQDYANNAYSMAYGRTDATLIEKNSITNPAELIPLELLIGRLESDGKTMKGGLSFDKAEDVHFWIQRAFPTKDKGDHNNSAPISTPATVTAFEENPKLQDIMKNCFRYYLNFMGYNLIEYGTIIDFEERADVTKRMQNIINRTHNFARITRIISSLNQHWLTAHAEAFRKLVTETFQAKYPKFKAKSAESFNFWRNAK